jgi:hypothetical protein
LEAARDVWNLVPVNALKLASGAHPAFRAIGTNRPLGEWVCHTVVASASAVAINDARAVRCGAVFTAPASIAEALLLGGVASTVAGARVVHEEALVSQTWATLDVAHLAPPALVALAAIFAAFAMLEMQNV